MDADLFNTFSEKVCDGTEYDMSIKEKYEFLLEVSKRMGIPLFEAFLMENTVDYARVYSESDVDDNDIIDCIHSGDYDSPCMDDIETCSWEICQTLGYEFE